MREAFTLIHVNWCNWLVWFQTVWLRNEQVSTKPAYNKLVPATLVPKLNTMEYCIVYFSNWVGPFQEEGFFRLLEQSRQNNAENGITGALLYVRGSVIQVLEGKQQTLEALYERIEQDPRHTNITRVLNRPIQERLFAQWSMGYETLTAQQLDEISALIELDTKAEKATPEGTPIILKTLKVFYESNRHN